MDDDGSMEYGKQYYQDNRKDLLEKKRQRYRNDTEYREKIQTAARERKRRITAERREARKDEDFVAKRKERPIWFTIEINGVDTPVRMHTSGQLAKRLGRLPQTMRVWEKRGILPEALYRNAAKDRLYTEVQVSGIVAAYDEAEERFGTALVSYRISSTNFAELVAEFWKQHPLGV